MGGFVGVYHFDRSRPVDAQLLVEQTDTLIHRGPDGGGVWIAPGVGLGHRRLSIIDIGGGAQPMMDASARYCVAFNGEIYNYRELRARLRGHGYEFRSESDTEVLLASYAHWGQACVDHFNGMFAFAIYDRERHELFLARDRLGKKPLYYYHDRERIVFASELKAILRDPMVPRLIDAEALADFFALAYVPSPKTIFQNIRKLPAGTRALCRGSAPVPSVYWDIDYAHVDTDASLEEHAKELRELIEDSINLRMRSDVPLGAFLSGGLDSSAVVGAMSRVSSGRVITQTVGFDDKAFDERSYAREVAEIFGTEHHEQVLTAEAGEVLQQLGYFYDEPFGDSSAVPTYYLCQETRKEVTVALSGDGGDACFAGYDHYAKAVWSNGIRDKLPGILRRAASVPLAHLFQVSRYNKRALELNQRAYLSSFEDRDRNAYHHLLPKPYRYRELLSKALLSQLGDYDPFTSVRDLYERSGSDDLVARMQYCDIKSYLCDDILVKVDRSSMAHSLEVRCPLLDHRIVECAARIPRHHKMAHGKSKIVLKAAVAPWIDAALFERDDQVFSVPFSGWLRDGLGPQVQEFILDPKGGKSGLLSAKNARRMALEDRSNRASHSHQLWNALMFEKWFDRFIERNETAPRPTDGMRRAKPTEILQLP